MNVIVAGSGTSRTQPRLQSGAIDVVLVSICAGHFTAQAPWADWLDDCLEALLVCEQTVPAVVVRNWRHQNGSPLHIRCVNRHPGSSVLRAVRWSIGRTARRREQRARGRSAQGRCADRPGELLDRALRRAPFGILRVSKGETVMAANHAAVVMLASNPAAIVGAQLSDVLGACEPCEITDLLQLALSGSGGRRRRLRCMHCLAERWLSVRAVRVSSQAAVPVLLVFLDAVSSRRSHAARDLSGLAHDLATLAPSADSPPAVPSGGACVARAAAPVERGMVAHDRALNKNRQPLERSPLDLNRSLSEDVQALWSAVAPGTLLRLDFGADLPPVLGVWSELKQVAVHLVANASAALLGNRGVVTVRTRTVSAAAVPELSLSTDGVPERSHVLFEVTDPGPVVDRGLRQRMLTPLGFATDNPSGVSAAWVERVIRAHGGVLGACSKPGVGTIQRVALPVAPAANPRTPRPHP